MLQFNHAYIHHHYIPFHKHAIYICGRTEDLYLTVWELLNHGLIDHLR